MQGVPAGMLTTDLLLVLTINQDDQHLLAGHFEKLVTTQLSRKIAKRRVFYKMSQLDIERKTMYTESIWPR